MLTRRIGMSLCFPRKELTLKTLLISWRVVVQSWMQILQPCHSPCSELPLWKQSNPTWKEGFQNLPVFLKNDGHTVDLLTYRLHRTWLHSTSWSIQWAAIAPMSNTPTVPVCTDKQKPDQKDSALLLFVVLTDKFSFLSKWELFIRLRCDINLLQSETLQHFYNPRASSFSGLATPVAPNLFFEIESWFDLIQQNFPNCLLKTHSFVLCRDSHNPDHHIKTRIEEILFVSLLSDGNKSYPKSCVLDSGRHRQDTRTDHSLHQMHHALRISAKQNTNTDTCALSNARSTDSGNNCDHSFWTNRQYDISSEFSLLCQHKSQGQKGMPGVVWYLSAGWVESWSACLGHTPGKSH